MGTKSSRQICAVRKGENVGSRGDGGDGGDDGDDGDDDDDDEGGGDSTNFSFNCPNFFAAPEQKILFVIEGLFCHHEDQIR